MYNLDRTLCEAMFRCMAKIGLMSFNFPKVIG